jgi:hypothetical protein
MDQVTDLPAGAGTVEFRFGDVPLLEGSYMIHVAVSSVAGGLVFDLREQDAMFEVVNPGRSRGLIDLEPSVEITTASPTSSLT